MSFVNTPTPLNQRFTDGRMHWPEPNIDRPPITFQTFSLYFEYSIFSVGCVIPLDWPRFPFNDMEISMVDICMLDVLIISVESEPTFWQAEQSRAF